MALTNTVRRGTFLPDSTDAENFKLTQLLAAGWVINSASLASNATTVSYGSHAMIVNGVLQILATNTLAIAGTLTASTTGAFVFLRSVGGTASNIVLAGAASVGAIAMGTIPASQIAFGMTIVACTATAFNGGTNSLADSSYTVSHYNFTGPTALVMSTELWTNIPG